MFTCYGIKFLICNTNPISMKTNIEKTKVAIIGTVGVPACYGGFETLIHHLVGYLNKDYNLSVYCSKNNYKPEERVAEWNGAKLIYLPLQANGIQSILYDIISIFHALFYADVLMVFGVSGCIVLPFIKLFTNKKIIVHIDGLEWRREKWSKPIRLFLKLSERIGIRYSDMDIADNASIQRYTAKYYQTLSQMIAYGGDHCNKEAISANDLTKYPFLYGKYAFKVARIEPENNIHLILETFERFTQYPIVIIGNWNSSKYGQLLKEKYSKCPSMYLVDPIYAPRELNVIRSNCYIYIHGHSAGGTNPSLVEAMNLELPILAYNVSFNTATTANKAMYFKTSDDLLGVLKSLTTENLYTNSVEMKRIAVANYTWKKVAQQYASLINMFQFGYNKSSVFSRFVNYDNELLLNSKAAHLKYSKLFYQS